MVTNKEDYQTIWKGKCRLALKGAIYAEEVAKAIERRLRVLGGA